MVTWRESEDRTRYDGSLCDSDDVRVRLLSPPEAAVNAGRSVSDALLDWVKAREEAATREEAEAQALLNRAARTHRFWRSAATNLASGLVVSALTECVRVRGRVAEDFAPDDLARVADLVEWLRPQVRDALNELPRRLPAELRLRGLQLDSAARHPRYTLEDGFVSINIDPAKPLARIVIRDGVTRLAPADAAAIADVAAATHSRLFRRTDRWVDPERLMAAYRSVLRTRGLAAGEDVTLASIRDALRPGKFPLPGDEFNVDLSWTLGEAARPGGMRVVVSNTRDTDQGLLLHGMEQSGYLGYLHIDGVIS